MLRALACALLSVIATAAKADWQALPIELDKARYEAALYTPASAALADGAARPPVVLFLHGAGERGQDLKLARSVGLPAIMQLPEEAVVVAPQVPAKAWWTDPPMMRLAMATLERALAVTKGDRNRVYLAGVSMGGHGALHLAARYPDTFAATLSVCPRLGRPNYLEPVKGIPADPAALGVELASMPLWLFHGDRDKIVPVRNSQQLYAALERLDAPVRFTEFADAPHAIWDRVFRAKAPLDWLFSHARN
ncbi:MAG: PHB depolymerase family esterase [Pseudomonadota bacterium]